MAYRVFRLSGILTNSIKICHATNNVIAVKLASPHIPLVQNVRSTSFFCKRPADDLWKSVTSVSNAGRRRGRAKVAGRKRNLNRGQIIGMGKVPIRFPGLNAPVFRGRELVEQCNLPEDPTRQQRLLNIRNQSVGVKRYKLSPIERGWSGVKADGRKIGPPDPIAQETFDGFDTWVLKTKTVNVITSTIGRQKRAAAFVVTGNGNGLAGFGVATSGEIRISLRKAKNRAGQRLMYIERYHDHTLLHDFFAQFGRSKVFAKQMPPGFGLVCHRAIKACCEAIGIKDMYAKVEGSLNVHNVIKAFFIGLLQQKTHQTMANEKKLHVVEFRKENGYFPTVVASPAKARTASEIPSSENLDYHQYLMNGKIVLQKKKPLPFYTKLPGWQFHLKKEERLRGQDQVRLRLKVEYGFLRSFLTDKYPEAQCIMWNKKRMDEERERRESQE